MDTEEKDDLDARLEMRLRDELRSQLDRQIGRAVPYFLERCAAQRGGLPMRRKRYVQRLTALATAAAVLCAVYLAWRPGFPWNRPDEPRRELVVVAPPADVQKIATNRDRDAPTHDSEETGAEGDSSDSESRAVSGHRGPAEALIVGRRLKTRTLDEGTLLVGRTPVRKVRRQWLERVEWFDPQNGARVQRIVPHEEVLFVPLPIN
ncbi:MAG TPA: hypothetical protein VG826_20930 [Pirellulales bacterium]|nr:hypothetical protein [Pirellulales bacterium]